jgi:Ni/Co efflux regulator RcnB
MFRKILAGLTLTVLVGALTVAADPPAWAGKDKHEKGTGQHAHHGDDRHHEREHHGRHFSDRDRVVVHEYYEDQFRRGKCPPGLAKKRNGCMPPGQAKKWHVGQPLPKSVAYYEVPPAIIVQLPPPSAGYRYVRVASDILLIAVGTGMVVDAIGDLGRM